MSKREPTDDSVSAQALTEEVQKVLDFHLICRSNNKKRRTTAVWTMSE